MTQNGHAHFKNLAEFCCKILKVCLTILGHYALKGLKFINVSDLLDKM